MSEVNDADESIVIQQLNHTLRDLFLLWFSVGFLHMERITWESACDILQKVVALYKRARQSVMRNNSILLIYVFSICETKGLRLRGHTPYEKLVGFETQSRTI